MPTDKTISTPKSTTKAAQSFDPILLAEIQDHAKQLKTDDSARDTMFDSIDEMYLMTYEGGSGKKWKKATVKQSPDARNAAQGALRLLVATDPIFNITDSKLDQAKTEKLETAITKIYDASGRAAGNPIHYDALLSAILYSEMHLAVTSTASLTEAAKQRGEGVARAERMEMITPYLIDVWNPRDGHAEFDALGLAAYYRETEFRMSELRTKFGALMPASSNDKKGTDLVTLKTFYDNTYTVQWIDQGTIIAQEHGLPFIPIVVQYTEGSRLWSKHEEARQPLLYTLLKSGLWEMQNLVYSVMFTLIRDMGVTPLYAHTTPPGMEGKPLDLDFDENPSIVHLSAGETFVPLINKGLIDPAVQQGLQLATQKGQESTVYPQALGAPIEGNSTFSELSLLSQSGRLPLISTQRRGSWGISAVMEMCLAMMKADGTKVKSPYIDLKASDIPDYVQIDTRLDVKLPQDKLQQANIATMLTSGESPLMPKDWVREHILNEPQSGQLEKDIWTEQAAIQKYKAYIQQQLMQEQMAQQQMMQQSQGMQAGGMQPQPGQSPQGMPMQPGQMQAGPQMSPEQAQMIQGGLPPQQAGMMPGNGQGVMPPEGM